MLLMWNSKIQIDGGGNSGVTASILEVRNLVVLRVRWFGSRPYLLLEFFVYKHLFIFGKLKDVSITRCLYFAAKLGY